MIIQTERLNIYPASRKQMEEIIAKEGIPELKEAYGEMLQGGIDHPQEWQWYAIWNIELSKRTKEVAGNLSFKGTPVKGSVEIGYGVNPSHEGRGIATEAVKAVVKWALKQEGVKRVEAETEEGNIASRRVLEKTGFVATGSMGEEGPRYVWKGKA